MLPIFCPRCYVIPGLENLHATDCPLREEPDPPKSDALVLRREVRDDVCFYDDAFQGETSGDRVKRWVCNALWVGIVTAFVLAEVLL